MERQGSAVLEATEARTRVVEQMLKFARAHHGEDPSFPVVRTGHGSEHLGFDPDPATAGLDEWVTFDSRREKAKQQHPAARR